MIEGATDVGLGVLSPVDGTAVGRVVDGVCVEGNVVGFGAVGAGDADEGSLDGVREGRNVVGTELGVTDVGLGVLGTLGGILAAVGRVVDGVRVGRSVVGGCDGRSVVGGCDGRSVVGGWHGGAAN